MMPTSPWTKHPWLAAPAGAFFLRKLKGLRIFQTLSGFHTRPVPERALFYKEMVRVVDTLGGETS